MTDRAPGGELRPRVFVSSVVEGFAEYREAARRGIEAAGGEPVLVNEDFPSLPVSSRNACLDAVDSVDFFVIILGARGGWTAPSGQLVVEEELERARARKIPVLALLQNSKRDAEGERLARRLSDYVDGTFRRTFTTPEQLTAEVERMLRPLIATPAKRSFPKRMARDYLASPYRIPSTAMLRFALSPEREEEVIDPVQLARGEFLRRIYEIGHTHGLDLFSYQQPKGSTIDGDALVITQEVARGLQGEGEHARLELHESGDVVIDGNVSGRVRRGPRHSMLDSMVVALEDIETIMATCFHFSRALYDEVDKFKRHQRFQYNVALSGLDYRTLERSPKERSSQRMSMRNRGAIIRAFDSPRLVSRDDLANPGAEIERAVLMLARRAED